MGSQLAVEACGSSVDTFDDHLRVLRLNLRGNAKKINTQGQGKSQSSAGGRECAGPRAIS